MKKILDRASMFVAPERREEFVLFIAPYIITSDSNMDEEESAEEKINTEDFITLMESKIESVFGIDKKTMYEDIRVRNVVYARHLCMWCIRKNTSFTLKQISVRYNRHHTTALHSYKMFEQLYIYDKTFRQQANAISEHLALHDFDMMKKDLNVLLATNKVY